MYDMYALYGTYVLSVAYTRTYANKSQINGSKIIFVIFHPFAQILPWADLHQISHNYIHIFISPE